MATVTLLALRTFVRAQIQEPVAGYWTDVELNLYINNAKNDLYNAINQINEDFFETKATISLAANDTTAALPATFFRLTNIRTISSALSQRAPRWKYMDQAKSDFVDGLDMNYNIDSVNEFLYDVVMDNAGANSLYISPKIPSDMDIEVSYVAQIPDLSGDTSTLQIFDSFATYIRSRATMYALMKGPTGDFGSWKTLAEEQLKNILIVAGRRQTKDPVYVSGFLEGE